MKWAFKDEHALGIWNQLCLHFCYFAVILTAISDGVAESRCHESAKIRAKYPDRIPVSTVT